MQTPDRHCIVNYNRWSFSLSADYYFQKDAFMSKQTIVLDQGMTSEVTEQKDA